MLHWSQRDEVAEGFDFNHESKDGRLPGKENGRPSLERTLMSRNGRLSKRPKKIKSKRQEDRAPASDDGRMHGPSPEELQDDNFIDDVITQSELADGRRAQLIQKAHNKRRDQIKSDLKSDKPVEDGELTPKIILTPNNFFTLEQILPYLPPSEGRLIKDATTDPGIRVLWIFGRADQNQTYSQLIPNPELITQESLQRYLGEVGTLRLYAARREEIHWRLQHGASIEPGPLSLKVHINPVRRFTQDFLEEVIGPYRAGVLFRQVSMSRWRRLYIIDAQGRPLGWHAGQDMTELSIRY